MKKSYEIHLAHRGRVDTYAFKTKAEKNKWLVEYLTYGNGSVWGRPQYEKHLEERKQAGKRPMSFERFILSLIKDEQKLVIRSRHEVILIREKN